MERSCETCWYNEYDEEMDSYICLMDLDEDEWYNYCMRGKNRGPFYRPGGDGNEYVLARKQ